MFSDEDEEEQIPVEDVVEELEQYWNYTKNLVKKLINKNTNNNLQLIYRTTNEPLTAQYLWRMFKNFTSPGKPTPSIEAVQIFMQRKIRLNLVTMENGVYKATKDLK